MDWTLDRAVGTVRASDDDRQYGRSWSRIDWMECGSATSNVDMLWMHVPRQYCIVSNSTRLWLRSLSLTHTHTHTHTTHSHRVFGGSHSLICRLVVCTTAPASLQFGNNRCPAYGDCGFSFDVMMQFERVTHTHTHIWTHTDQHTTSGRSSIHDRCEDPRWIRRATQRTDDGRVWL